MNERALRALVIDDDDVARELLSATLREAGYKTFQLPSPIGATQVILREEIEILVLDVQMPDMNGDKLAKLLRKNARLASLAIVLVSSGSETELRRLVAEVDADALVVKRDIVKRLGEAVSQALSSRDKKKRAT